MAYQLLNTRWGGTTLTCMKKATSRNKWLIFPQHHTGHRKLHEIVLRAFWKIGGKKQMQSLETRKTKEKSSELLYIKHCPQNFSRAHIMWIKFQCCALFDTGTRTSNREEGRPGGPCFLFYSQRGLYGTTLRQQKFGRRGVTEETSLLRIWPSVGTGKPSIENIVCWLCQLF